MTLQPCTVCGGPSGWQCSLCGAKCSGHVRRIRDTRIRFRCAECQGGAVLLRARRADQFKFEDRLLPALKGTFAGHGAIATGACGIVFMLVAFPDAIGALGAMLGSLLALIVGLAMLRASASGRDFDWSFLGKPYEEVVLPLARALAAALPAIVVAHVLIYVLVLFPYGTEIDHARSAEATLLTSACFWTASVVCALYVPLSLLHASTTSDWAIVFNPLEVVRPVLRWWRELGPICAAAFGAIVIDLLVEWLLPRGVVGALITGTLVAASVFATCSLIGALIWLHPDAFDWGGPEEGWVDLGDPRAPLAVEPDTVRPVSSPRVQNSLEGRVLAALEARDATAVIKLFLSDPEADQKLAHETLMRIGQVATAVEEHKLAVRAFAGAGRTSSPESARPLVMAARILDERLNDHAGARLLYAQAAERFPDTQAGQFAELQLEHERLIGARKAG